MFEGDRCLVTVLDNHPCFTDSGTAVSVTTARILRGFVAFKVELNVGSFSSSLCLVL